VRRVLEAGAFEKEEQRFKEAKMAVFRLSGSPLPSQVEENEEVLDCQLIRLLLTDAGSEPLSDDEVTVLLRMADPYETGHVDFNKLKDLECFQEESADMSQLQLQAKAEISKAGGERAAAARASATVDEAAASPMGVDMAKGLDGAKGGADSKGIIGRGKSAGDEGGQNGSGQGGGEGTSRPRPSLYAYVPEGLAGGNIIILETADGGDVTVAIPPGLTAGEVFCYELPQSSAEAAAAAAALESATGALGGSAIVETGEDGGAYLSAPCSLPASDIKDSGLKAADQLGRSGFESPRQVRPGSDWLESTMGAESTTNL